MNCIEPHANGDVLFRHIKEVLNLPDGIRNLSISIKDGAITGWQCKCPTGKDVTLQWSLVQIASRPDIEQIRAEVGESRTSPS
jgi:hypothetical protein